jgi:membrane-associated protease RseP (regulator of RpoE activity)
MARNTKEQYPMRTTAFALFALIVASPIAAQEARHKVVMLNQDTLVTMEFGDAESCSVKIGDRTLSESQARDICAVKRRTVTFTTDAGGARLQLDNLRAQLRTLGTLDSSRVALLRQQESELARALSSRSLALTDEAKRAFEITTRPGGTFTNAFSTMEQGSIIGVSIDARPRDTDRWGAYVAGVTPGYPADKAGIRAGDIITRIDGQALTSGRTERAASETESLVWLRLSELVRKLEPGKEVELQYRRDDRSHTTRVTPIEDQRWLAIAPSVGSFVRTPGASSGVIAPVPSERGDLVWRFGRNDDAIAATTPFPPGGDAFFTFGSPIANLELAPVNEKLGAYFGTTRGVLVISAPAERNLSLEPGDVITAIDGRNVDTPAEFIRALRSYDRGKSFTLQVTRQKQRQTISTTLP